MSVKIGVQVMSEAQYADKLCDILNMHGKVCIVQHRGGFSNVKAIVEETWCIRIQDGKVRPLYPAKMFRKFNVGSEIGTKNVIRSVEHWEAENKKTLAEVDRILFTAIIDWIAEPTPDKAKNLYDLKHRVPAKWKKGAKVYRGMVLPDTSYATLTLRDKPIELRSITSWSTSLKQATRFAHGLNANLTWAFGVVFEQDLHAADVLVNVRAIVQDLGRTRVDRIAQAVGNGYYVPDMLDLDEVVTFRHLDLHKSDIVHVNNSKNRKLALPK